MFFVIDCRVLTIFVVTAETLLRVTLVQVLFWLGLLITTDALQLYTLHGVKERFSYVDK